MTEIYHDILRKYWGYDHFRPLQLEIIESIGSGKDTLGLMPTGGGKSITFQVPALTKEGTCLVITPLIALMKDQVQQLNKRGIYAAAIYAGLKHQQILQILENTEYGAYKFLYISPERLASELFVKRLSFLNISMIAVDEAHCISQWGYDFRPSYLNIANIRTILPNIPILALTATATHDVVEDIQNKLQFKTKNAFRKSFYRENLTYVVRQTDNKVAQLLNILQNVDGSSIVYVRSRLKTQEICSILQQNGITANYYHAGLVNKLKDERQQAWNNGSCRVIVATNAFGMGIDKPNVRSVIHMDLPDNIEAYFQEAGRAGRDGQRAYALLLYNNTDIGKLKKRISDNFPEKEMIKQVYQSLADFYTIGEGSGQGSIFPFEIEKFSVASHLPILQTFSAIKILELSGWLELTDEQESPSKLQITTPRENLYRLNLQYEKLENLLENLLRNYTGILNGMVHINEDLLAEQLDTTRQDVYNMLQHLDIMNIVRYVPFKKVPLLIYTQQRCNADSIHISKSAYEERKERFERRIHAMIDYVQEENICRSRQLLYYFGEKKSEDCGQCDVCIRKKKARKSNELDIKLGEKILSLLERGPLAMEEISHKLRCPIPDIIPTLRTLVADGLVIYNNQEHLFSIKS